MKSNQESREFLNKNRHLKVMVAHWVICSCYGDKKAHDVKMRIANIIRENELSSNEIFYYFGNPLSTEADMRDSSLKKASQFLYGNRENKDGY